MEVVDACDEMFILANVIDSQCEFQSELLIISFSFKLKTYYFMRTIAQNDADEDILAYEQIRVVQVVMAHMNMAHTSVAQINASHMNLAQLHWLVNINCLR